MFFYLKMKYLKHYWKSTKPSAGDYLTTANSIDKRHPEAEFPGLDVQIWMHDADGCCCVMTMDASW